MKYTRRDLLRSLAALTTAPAALSPLQAATGLTNRFHLVAPSIYRGAQPEMERFADLAALGIRTVLNLRSSQDGVERERRVVEGLGMRFVNIPLRGYRSPTDEAIGKALVELDEASRTKLPAFVHCKLGKDRTGTVIACYRIARQGWGNEDALREAKKLGMSPLQYRMQRYVRNFRPRVEEAGGSSG